MTIRFTVLASGSGGNASLVEVGDFGVLIDVGLGPRQLNWRLTAAGKSWSRVAAVFLTHLHCDHWREPTLAYLLKRQIPLYCHTEHRANLASSSSGFAGLLKAGLVNEYAVGELLVLGPGLCCRPL